MARSCEGCNLFIKEMPAEEWLEKEYGFDEDGREDYTLVRDRVCESCGEHNLERVDPSEVYK